jgi:hypothetical protein
MYMVMYMSEYGKAFQPAEPVFGHTDRPLSKDRLDAGDKGEQTRLAISELDHTDSVR